MALFTRSEVIARANRDLRYDSAQQVIEESVASFRSYVQYDMFLSYCTKDLKIALGIRGIFADLGYQVYIDRVDDPSMNPSSVCAETAEQLRRRMRNSKSLMFVTSENYSSSRWMPWECGYFDGLRGKVAIVPVVTHSSHNRFDGQEYLGLYPYCVKQTNRLYKEKLWIHLDQYHYLEFDEWVAISKDGIVWREVSQKYRTTSPAYAQF